MYLKFLARFSYLEERNVGKRLLVTESTLTEANGKKYRNMNVKRNSCEEEQASSTAPLQQHFLFKIETHLSGVVWITFYKELVGNFKNFLGSTNILSLN